MICLAAASSPFGAHQILILLVVLAGVACLMVAIRLMGEMLARTHPEAPARPRPKREAAPKVAGPAPAEKQVLELSIPAIPSIDPETLAVIAAATSDVIKGPYRIVAVSSPRRPPVESLMQVWSWEGRRQIYSSHRVR
jgi:Na+-transporting methylmalonyl-CoA/oxaloacetate decarboxylase gamma subunit